MNKKGQIAETITWFMAVIVILFMMVVFVLFSGVIAGQKLKEKGQARSIEAGVASYSADDYMNYQRLESFLNYRINERKIVDILSDNNAEEIDKYNAQIMNAAKIFFENVEGLEIELKKSGTSVWKSGGLGCENGYQLAKINLNDRIMTSCQGRISESEYEGAGKYGA